MTRFNQNAVVEQLNVYLKSRQRDKVLELGYCHGFTMLWLYRMSMRKEAGFYQFIKNLVNAKTPQDFDDLEMDIEKFLAHIEWMQNPFLYSPSIQQLDLDSVLEAAPKLALSSVISARQLEDVVNLIAQPNQMICLSGPTHTIGLYQRGDTYYLFNPNYDEGEPRPFTDKKLLTQEIMLCLYKKIGIPTMKVSLEINIVTNPDIKKPIKTKISKTEFLQLVADSSEKVQGVDDFGIDSLYLAVENNDIETATYLLSRGANPNHVRVDGKSPFYLAAMYGYAPLVDLLLEHGAKHNLVDDEGCSPLYRATDNEHLEVAKILLKNGANPLQASHEYYTPLDLAIRDNNWELVLLMTLSIKNIKPTAEKYHEEFKEHQTHINNALRELKKILSASEMRRLGNVLKQVIVAPEITPPAEIKTAKNRHRFFPYERPYNKKMAPPDPLATFLPYSKPNV